MQTKRLEYLDFIKGIAIILVVFCHRVIIPQESVLGTVCMMLVCSAVPCFMMCSGYILLFRKERAMNSLRRAMHVYVCMVIWKALYLVYFQLIAPFETDMQHVLRYLFVFYNLRGVETEHFWFLQAYLPALLVTPLFAPMFCERRYGMIAGFTGLAYFSNQFVMSINLLFDFGSKYIGYKFFDVNTLSNIFPIGGEYSSMLVCFLLGGVFRLLEEKGVTRKPKFLLASALCAAGGLAGMLVVRYLQMGSFQWQGKLLVAQYEWTSTLVMSFGVFGLLRYLGENRAAEWIGRNIVRHSMGIYYLHYLCIIPLVMYVYPLLPVSLWWNVAKTALVVAVSAGLTALGKRVPYVRELMR